MTDGPRLSALEGQKIGQIVAIFAIKLIPFYRSKHQLFIQNLRNEVNSKPKKFWSYVKSKTGDRVIPSDMIF